jgi:hypothetical protein
MTDIEDGVIQILDPTSAKVNIGLLARPFSRFKVNSILLDGFSGGRGGSMTLYDELQNDTTFIRITLLSSTFLQHSASFACLLYRYTFYSFSFLILF